MLVFPLLCALIFALGNLMSQFIHKKRTGGKVSYFQCMHASIAGSLIGITYDVVYRTGYVNEVLFYLTTMVSVVMVMSILSGLIHLGLDNRSKRFNHFILILAGLFNSGGNSSFSNIFQLYSRFSLEILQTILGYVLVQLFNIIGKVNDVIPICGATFCFYFHDSEQKHGVSIGPFIYISTKHGKISFRSDPLLLHEYGHQMQSRKWGILYLFVIGIPSLLSALRSKPLSNGLSTHDLKWYELQANQFAAEFRKQYFAADWVQFEPPIGRFPREKQKAII